MWRSAATDGQKIRTFRCELWRRNKTGIYVERKGDSLRYIRIAPVSRAAVAAPRQIGSVRDRCALYALRALMRALGHRGPAHELRRVTLNHMTTILAAPDPAPAAAVAPPTSSRAARCALVAILGLAAVLRLWHLDQNGYGREYYAAGVRSQLDSWLCFFFNSFDPAGFVSLDKPPVALWLQVASAKIFGFSAFSVMLPQVLEGLIAVALIHHLVARRFGQAAGLLAALFLAVTPISVAIDRSNNTDSCLIMVLLFAAWALIRATETASARLLVLALALVGVGFNVKMATALVVAPTFAVVYLLGAPSLSVKRRLVHLGFAAVVMVSASLSWVTAFDLTPPAQRPYAGSTKSNSMLELALLHNGLNRFISRAAAEPAPDSGTSPAAPPAGSAALWDQTPVGALRLATPHLAGQVGWWLPLAIAGALLGAAPRLGRRRLSATQANVLVWAGWAFTYAVVFSLAGGVFHTYYTAVLAPPLAALAGIGAALLWQRGRAGSSRWALPVVLFIAAAWQAYIQQGVVTWRIDDVQTVLLVAVVGALLIAGAGLGSVRSPRKHRHLPAGLAMLSLLSMLVMPLAWALSTVLVRPNVAAPAADIAKQAAALDEDDVDPPLPARSRSRKLVEFLRAQRQSEKYLLAVPNALQAAPLIVRTGEPVMAMGGYLGRDPILTPSDLERMVNDGELRYVIVGGRSIVPPDTRRERELAHWIRTHGQRVDPALWREAPDPNRPAVATAQRPRTPARLYDLRPDRAGPR
jgi:4-amino-4-deoxy-L-arabinose transferase-like glycosyltransferase